MVKYASGLLYWFSIKITIRAFLVTYQLRVGEELLLHNGAKFERVFHTTHFFVTNFFVISRCKDTNLFLFGKTIFRDKSFERFSQCWRDASKLLCIWRCNNSLDGNSVISILLRCYEKSHLPEVIYRSFLNIICCS